MTYGHTQPPSKSEPGLGRRFGFGNRWSAATFLAAALLSLLGLAAIIGLAAGSFRLGVLLLMCHALTSLLAGLVVGVLLGPSLFVSAHLGLYNLASPLAVWLRVRWLRKNRPGFLRPRFLAVFFAAYISLMSLGVWLLLHH